MWWCRASTWGMEGGGSGVGGPVPWSVESESSLAFKKTCFQSLRRELEDWLCRWILYCSHEDRGLTAGTHRKMKGAVTSVCNPRLGEVETKILGENGTNEWLCLRESTWFLGMLPEVVLQPPHTCAYVSTHTYIHTHTYEYIKINEWIN